MEGSAPDTTTDFSLTMGDITSPSQLHEVTLDQDNTLSNSMGLRSPGGPMRGRSVKEFEEQLGNLKKENFNLKLRIYFLEERMGVNFNLDKENIIKKNVELLVEVEGLRKDVQEKHELLCQAVKAMELEDEEHKKLLNEKEETIAECQHEIDCLKSQLIDIKAESEILSSKSYYSGPTEFYSTQTLNGTDVASSVRDLQEKIRSLEEELLEEKENNAAIQIVLDQNDSKIKQLTSELEEAQKQLASRDEEFANMNFQLEEFKSKCQGMGSKLEEKSHFANELTSEIGDLRKRVMLLSNDLEKERKRSDRLKVSSEHKVSELQSKLEASLAELKKSQELVVSKSLGRRSGNTDADSFSVPKPAASPGSPQKDSFLFPPIPSPVITPTSSPSPSVNFAEEGVDLRQIIEQLKTERDVQHQKVVKLKAEQMKACKIIKSMIESRNKTNEEMAALKEKNEELERELEGVVSGLKVEGDNKPSNLSSSSMSHEHSMDEQSGELIEHYKALTDELEEKNRILMATLEEKDKQVKMVHGKYEELLENLKQKDKHIIDLEFELLANDAEENQSSETTKEQETDFYIQQLKEKNEEIEHLSSKLQKKNCDLQGLVNTELWEKNRTIEKLQKQGSKILENRDHEIKQLQTELKNKHGQLELIKSKISEMGFEIKMDSGDINIENNVQTELEKSEKLREQSNEMCTILSTRLEEMAIFLDSLLKQKSVLGFLGSKENKRLRQIINQSLDLSRTFTMSMIINPDQSLLQLTSITSILNDTDMKDQTDEYDNSAARLSLVPSDASLTYRSHLYKKNDEDSSQIIQTLREEIINLKYELRLRDVELNKINVGVNLTEVSSDKEDELVKSTLNTSTTLKYKSDIQSESEAWSEPDRNVSRARIGLLDNSLKSNSSKKSIQITSTDSTEDEEVNRSSRTPSKKALLNESRNTILELHKQNVELEQKVSEKEMDFYEVSKINNKLQQEMTNLKTKLSDTETLLKEATSRKKEAETKAEQLQVEKDELFEKLTKKDKELEEKINQVEKEKLQALEVAKQADEAAEKAKTDMEVATTKLHEIEQQMNELEESLRTEYENQLGEKMQTVEEESLREINRIQSMAEVEIKTLHNTIQQMHIDYTSNYVKKVHVEQAIEEIERLKTEIESFEDRIDTVKRERETAVDRLTEYEDKVNLLRSELDNATLQYSEAVLEKTKIANEKALIEQELNRSALKEVDAKRRVDQVENELYDLRQDHQKQVSLLQQQKAKLEMRVSELESSNAELHNRLIKIQAGCGDHVTSSSLPNTPNFINQMVTFRRQHSENSAYLSEDPLTLEDVRAISARSLNRLLPNQNFEIERNEANSSPDLGIESDHGRFSSLETHLNVHRPLLQTLELTESMNNLLDVEGNDVQAALCDNTHCCQKTLEMAHENNDLKRKLLRTRRALEETVTQLTLANQRKKQVEKTICRQIHKTSQVLRKAKANLDSGSETDVYKK